jgi:hypothetical protein
LDGVRGGGLKFVGTTCYFAVDVVWVLLSVFEEVVVTSGLTLRWMRLGEIAENSRA